MRILLFSALVVMPFYWLCLCNHVFVVSGLCLEDQRSLLLQLKNNFTFISESSSKLKWWNTSHDCCSWIGVSCDQKGYVTGLDLSGESISAGFDNSSVLFTLQHLHKLNLADNNFSSLIPSGFNKLDKLTYLNLSNAGFVGQIPIQISQIESLSVIVLDWNNISSPLPETFAHLRNLTILSLVGCELIGTFPQKIFNIGTLEVIDISSNNNLHGFFTDFPFGRSLQTLRVSRTNFAGVFPYSIGNLRNLSDLDLSFCGFNGTLPNSLSNLTKLSYLDLSFNSFTGPLPSFCTAKKLTYLDLSDNGLSGIVPSSHFEGLQNIVSINLNDNSFTGSIPSSLFTLPSLQEIRLAGNEFSQFDEFINVTSSRLKILELAKNNLSGSIPSSLFTFPSLQQIWLSHNQYTQLEELVNVSSSILHTLDLGGNNLSGPFPTSIFQLSTLSVLRLFSNKFNGLVQLNKLFELRNLTALDLSYNNFSLNVNFTNVNPSSFLSISNLKLASCNLKTFPGFLRNLPRLTYLDLSDNQMQGTVPNWIWKLENLQILNISHNLLTHLEGPLQNLTSSLYVLDLHYNKLQGPIPVFPKYANVLDYSSNKFSSFIPPDIGNYLSSTFFLSLSNNTLHGSIPNSFCNASSLLMLDLSMNNISGTIPSCLMMMSRTLAVLNLKNNNLSGPIPDTIPSSCGLSTLNLHGNLLDGSIPKSLAYCSMLEVLDLGSNQIIGGFPCFLKEISTLRVLVLRNNKFQGSLRCSKANKTWEMLQIVDIAFNNFSGELQGKYFTSWKRNIMHDEDQAGSKFIEKFFYKSDDESLYYQDSVTVINKGQQQELVKILTIFTCIDFSSNHIEGPIPEDLMDFKALYIMNLSNNALSGQIPSSIGNLRQLESLDLSQNSLSGKIPIELASLSFLSYLNLSFNHLMGKIPTGTQIQSFEASSFEGNDGLFGPPLTEKPDGKESGVLPQPACERLACTIDWNFISVELGLLFGHGIVFGPLLIWKRWRVWYWQLIHKILCWIFPQMYLEYVTHRGQTYATLRRQ
ncbi:Receptor-like protein 12, partial [Mucuna pruriens]